MIENKILVFSIAVGGYSALFTECIRSQKQYCKKLRFDYILVDKSPKNLFPKEAAWLKIFLLRAALEGDYDWVAFIDADCEIRNHAPSFVEDFQEIKGDKSIFLAHGFSGRINSGVIFLKNTKEARDYLEQVINNGDREVPDEDKALYENGHMIHYGKNNPHVQIIEAIKWNNNFAMDERSYIQHYSGGILREQYINRKPFKKIKYLLIRKFNKKISSAFAPNGNDKSIKKINVLVDFYKGLYPEFRR